MLYMKCKKAKTEVEDLWSSFFGESAVISGYNGNSHHPVARDFFLCISYQETSLHATVSLDQYN